MEKSDVNYISTPQRELVRRLHADYIGYTGILLEQYGQTIFYYLKPHTNLITIDPELIFHILFENKANYIKGTMVPGTAYYRLRAAFGDSLFNTDNKEIWRKHRAVALERLNPEKFPGYTTVMNEILQKFLKDWEEALQKNKLIDLKVQFSTLTLSILLQTLFYDIKFDIDTFTSALRQYGDDFGAAVRIVERTLANIVSDRRNHPHTSNPDFLDLLIKAYEAEPDRQVADKYIFDELKAFLAAGHETTAASLTWLFYLFSKNPHEEEKIYQEVIKQLGDRPFTLDDMTHLPYTLAAFKEAIRLYPPAHEIDRVALEDDNYKGIQIPRGAYVKIPLYHVHRQKQYWQDPEKFMPERFLKNPSGQNNPHAYIPFGMGPRMCIGKDFASTEVVLIISSILRKYRLQFPENYQPILLPLATFWPKDPVLVQVKPR